MSSAPATYRRATENDAWNLICVHYAAISAIGNGVYSDAVLLAWSPPPDERRRARIAELITQSSTICIVADLKDTLIAFGIALPSERWLRALYVHPDHSGKGVGQELLHRLELQCSGAGVSVLNVNASHNAEGFYRCRGYEVVGPTSQALTDTLSMPATHMLKRLSPTA